MITILSFALSVAALGQAPSRVEIVSAARDVIEKARFCSLVTLGEDGHPQARIVDPIAPDETFTMWIATNPLTRKTQQIRRDGRVTLLCFDQATASYVTVLGRAALVADAPTKRAHWKDDWSQIYRDGPDSREVVLIRVTPARLEVVSESRGMIGDAKTWRPVAIEFPK